MRYTDKITIENPSRKLEERLREIGVRKYLRLKKLAKDDMSSAKRSRLFSNMFERYINCHNIGGIRNQVVTVKGIAEDYFAHVIVREEHIYLAKIIGEGVQKDFGK